jgi:hypothetical protein
MSPRVPIQPKPPDRIIRAMSHEPAVSFEREYPLLSRYFMMLRRSGFWKGLVLHYAFVLLLTLIIWPQVSSGVIHHSEILLKLIGSYCFLVGTIAIPLTAPLFLPDPEDSDPAVSLIPFDPASKFDIRFIVILTVSSLALFPLLPYFLIVGPVLGRVISPLDILVFLQGILSAGWVYLLMEMVSGSAPVAEKLGRRLSLVFGLQLLHIIFTGLMAQFAFPTLQTMNPLKLIIDVNPFSQMFILMEGPSQNRLIVNTDFQRLIDFRIYLFLITGAISFVTLLIFRSHLRRYGDGYFLRTKS